MRTHRPVTLEEILAARDARAAFQQTLLEKYPGAALVCLMVNIPGPVKQTALSERVFSGGIRALVAALAEDSMTVLFSQEHHCPTGSEAYFVVDGEVQVLKRRTCGLEESLPYGRLLDMDVHTKSGQLSRVDAGYLPRGCMVCGKTGSACASRRLHSLEELLETFNRLAQFAPEEDT